MGSFVGPDVRFLLEDVAELVHPRQEALLGEVVNREARRPAAGKSEGLRSQINGNRRVGVSFDQVEQLRVSIGWDHNRQQAIFQ